MPRERYELLAMTLEAAGVGGWTLDVATSAVSWTDVMFRIHDLEPGTPPTLDAALLFYPPDTRPLIIAAIERAIEHGDPWDVELPLITARGRAIWVRARGRAIRQNGRIIQLAGAFQDVTARRALAVQAERLSVVARQTTNGVVITDTGGHAEWVNDAFTRLTGYTLADLRGRRPDEVLRGPETDPQTNGHIAACLARGEGYEVEAVNYTRDGDASWMATTCTALRNAAGIVTGFITVQSDITARKLAEEETRHEAAERRRAEALLRDILDTLPMAVSAYDPEERLILTNRCLHETLPILAAYATPGRALEEVLRLSTLAGQFPQAGETPETREAWSAGNLKVHRQANATRTFQLPGGRFVQARERRSAQGNLVCVRTDMTDLKRVEAALRIQAEQDALTLLANRTALLHTLENLLAPGASAPAGGALILLDVDYFKQVNDTVGHDAGDALLVEIAMRLHACTRRGDTAARLGGDEFAVLLPGLTNDETAAARLAQLHATLSQPADCLGHHLHIGISAGMTVFPADGLTAERLMKNADLALYEAKRNGRGRWCRYRPEQAVSLEHHVHMADSLREAIENGRVEVALQPKRLLRGGHDGFEALARWHDGKRWVSPTEFVPVAEDSGLIVPLGKFVLETALGRIAALRAMGLQPGAVALNISGAQLLDPAFQHDVVAALRRNDLGPASLEFELTETVLLGRAIERIEQTLHSFRALGICLALDDFGTGFASLAHVARLPIQRLKIDRAFVGGIGGPGRGSVIARAVIGLAHGMDMQAAAVGVETQAQMAFLQDEECDAMQGYLIAPPLLGVEEAAAYLRAVPVPGMIVEAAS